MKKPILFILLGLVMMAVALYGFSMNIDKPGHYFGSGTFFGIGASLIAFGFSRKKKSNSLGK